MGWQCSKIQKNPLYAARHTGDFWGSGLGNKGTTSGTVGGHYRDVTETQALQLMDMWCRNAAYMASGGGRMGRSVLLPGRFSLMGRMGAAVRE